MRRIADAFRHAGAENRAAFIAYLPAGFPDEATFLDAATRVLEHADLLEVGLPFSDPLGDGPTIQRATERALRQGTTTAKTLDLVRTLRRRSDKPLLLMTYYNPIYCYPGGEAAFAAAAKEAGADGVILPDLPPDEGEAFIAACRAVDLDTVFLVAPTSTDARLQVVTGACRGFVYAVSVTGVTGARDSLPSDVAELVTRTRAAGSLPVAVGFGVGSAATARRVAAHADGVVVGSALVQALDRGADIAAFAAELAGGCRRGG
jgi:tryptophan synthase alpha chain